MCELPAANCRSRSALVLFSVRLVSTGEVLVRSSADCAAVVTAGGRQVNAVTVLDASRAVAACGGRRVMAVHQLFGCAPQRILTQRPAPHGLALEEGWNALTPVQHCVGTGACVRPICKMNVLRRVIMVSPIRKIIIERRVQGMAVGVHVITETIAEVIDGLQSVLQRV